jgi:LacI family transcriptional regulator
VPSVIVNSVGTASASGVRLEDDLATTVATQHLIGWGHRDIVFVAGPPSAASDLRTAGFTMALQAAGIPLQKGSILSGGWESQEAFDAVSAAIARGQRPTGFVVVNAATSLGVLSALYQAGIRVPEDASVIGVHDAWFAPHLTPALTTVALPMFELGRRSVLQLLTHLAEGKPDDVIISRPAPQLVLRQSTRHL